VNLKQEIERVRKGLRAVGLYRQCVRPGQLCFDIGANKGSRAIIFTLLGARTVALEPNETLTRTLRRVPRVTVVNKAVSDQPGRKTLLVNANDQISSLNPDWQSKWPEFPDWSQRAVDCVTLDQLVAEYGLPDFCKIDVEGHEPAVLRGLSRPIPLFSFEASPDFSENTQTCMELLARLGEYQFNYAVGDDFAWISPRWVSRAEVPGLVAAGAGDVYARLVRKPSA
jgi:FkbM family methyltransferase